MPPSPAARKLIAESGATVTDGSGVRGQVLKEDVIAAAIARSPLRSLTTPRRLPPLSPHLSPRPKPLPPRRHRVPRASPSPSMTPPAKSASG